MFIDFLISVFKENLNNEAIIWKNNTYNYKCLCDSVKKFQHYIDFNGIQHGAVVALEGDFSPNSIAILLALIEKMCIVVPISYASKKNEEKFCSIAKVEYIFRISEEDVVTIEKKSENSNIKYYNSLRDESHPGLVLFSSGTTGEPKAAVHDFLRLLEKFKTKRVSLKTLNFLLFDHWGGLNTMFHILSNGGTVITSQDRSVDVICNLIEKYQIELLPTSPSFLNLMLISGVYKQYNLNSLKIISYGTEPMPENTLKRLRMIFPKVKLLQTYGLIELGVMRSKSEDDDSLWVKIGGEGYETRIIDGLLQIKAKSVMLGYLNAPSPFTEDGWFITGDAVEEKGEYIKILGRKSELINVGGEKVYPTEVESVIQEMDNVAEVTVYGEKNLIMGNIVCANVCLIKKEDKELFITRLKKYCINRLQKYKVPIKVIIVSEKQYSERFKKKRFKEI